MHNNQELAWGGGGGCAHKKTEFEIACIVCGGEFLTQF